MLYDMLLRLKSTVYLPGDFVCKKVSASYFSIAYQVISTFEEFRHKLRVLFEENLSRANSLVQM